MAEFPSGLFEAAHQEEIFSAMFGSFSSYKQHLHLRPKIAYRSDTSSSIYLMYVIDRVCWVAVVNPSRDRDGFGVNVQDYWILPGDGSDGPGAMMLLIQAFFTDVSYYINERKIPQGRTQR